MKLGEEYDSNMGAELVVRLGGVDMVLDLVLDLVLLEVFLEEREVHPVPTI